MPDNRMGDQHTMSIPRPGHETTQGGDFEVIRMLDGHISPMEDQPAITDADLINRHEIS